MPRNRPTTPSKSSHPRPTGAKSAETRAFGKHGVRAPIPPRKHSVNVGHDHPVPAENGVTYHEPEEQTRDGGSREDGDAYSKDGSIRAPSPEQIAPPPGLFSDAGHPKKRRPRPHPQRSISKLWRNFDPEYLGRVTKILPETAAATSLRSQTRRSQNAAESYQEARAACEEIVGKIIEECTALNQKYTDVHFDLERDLKITRKRDCLDGLVQSDEDHDNPSDVKRVTDLFENPRFFSDGAGFDDMIQGAIGDCWLMSAFSVLSCREDLIRRVCVIQDQDVGVYGFVFFRDGEWHPTIIDDKLYLKSLAFDESISTMLSAWGKEQEQKYTELFQRGSKALYFASCRDDNETWVPLLEKALAKAHGGYDALRGGQTGEAIEDLTGGVTTEVYSTNILSKEKFWKNELRRIGKDFMFDATDAMYREWQFYDETRRDIKDIRDQRRQGVQARHAYAVLFAYEGHGERLIKIRNPWGESEWGGAWSDGSPQWTAQWLERLDHKFGDDGVFWMSYKDFLNHYKHINRTRIFDESWYSAQKWASIQVPFNTIDYQPIRFRLEVPETTETVIVLSQLDSRYFSGLEGKYRFQLHFRVSHADNEKEYIARSRPNYELERSTNLELLLKKGTYTILVKVEATDWTRWGYKSPEEVIRANLPHRKEKVTTIGRLYDLAHQKGLVEDDEDEEAELDPRRPEQEMPPSSASQVFSAEMLQPTRAESESDTDSDAGSDSTSYSSNGSDSEQGARAPWNASCVVGLRVLSKEAELSVKVVRDSKKGSRRKYTLPQLDRDAITRAPQDEAEKHATPVELRKLADKVKSSDSVQEGSTAGTMGQDSGARAAANGVFDEREPRISEEDENVY